MPLESRKLPRCPLCGIPLVVGAANITYDTLWCTLCGTGDLYDLVCVLSVLRTPVVAQHCTNVHGLTLFTPDGAPDRAVNALEIYGRDRRERGYHVPPPDTDDDEPDYDGLTFAMHGTPTPKPLTPSPDDIADAEASPDAPPIKHQVTPTDP